MFYKNPSVVPREEEAGKYLVFNPDNCIALVMNETSHTIWELCDGTRDSAIIASELQKACKLDAANVTEANLEEIVAEHLAILSHAQLIIDDRPAGSDIIALTS